MEDNFYDETMEMPTPCVHCNTIFDLNDGYGSEKWYPNTTICEDCYREEEKEIEEDEYYDTLNIELSNALYGINEKKGAWARIDKENQALIIQLVSQCNEQLMAMLTSRVLTIQSEPDGMVRETMINNLLIDINCG